MTGSNFKKFRKYILIAVGTLALLNFYQNCGSGVSFNEKSSGSSSSNDKASDSPQGSDDPGVIDRSGNLFYLCTSSRSQVKHVLILHDVDQYNYHRANDCNQAASQNELSNGRFELSQSNVLDFFASNPNMYQLPKGTVMDDWEEILLGPETCRLKKRAGGGHRR